MAFEHDILWTSSKPRRQPVEKIFYEEGNVKITNLLAIFGILIGGYALFLSERTKPEYVIQLDSPYDLLEVHTCHSEEEAAMIAVAINEAIAWKDDL